MLRVVLLAIVAASVSAFKVPTRVPRPQMQAQVQKAATSALALAVAAHAETAHAAGVLGVNGALDFGPLAGAQPGGEGTGKALGVNDTSLFGILLAIPVIIGLLFSQWQDYQDDDEDFFDGYDSRRDDKDLTNRNRV